MYIKYQNMLERQITYFPPKLFHFHIMLPCNNLKKTIMIWPTKFEEVKHRLCSSERKLTSTYSILHILLSSLVSNINILLSMNANWLHYVLS